MLSSVFQWGARNGWSAVNEGRGVVTLSRDGLRLKVDFDYNLEESRWLMTMTGDRIVKQPVACRKEVPGVLDILADALFYPRAKRGKARRQKVVI